jgi:hypothetical protein
MGKSICSRCRTVIVAENHTQALFLVCYKCALEQLDKSMPGATQWPRAQRETSTWRSAQE